MYQLQHRLCLLNSNYFIHSVRAAFPTGVIHSQRARALERERERERYHFHRLIYRVHARCIGIIGIAINERCDMCGVAKNRG